MPLLAAFIGTLFGSLVEFFGKYLAKKAANTLATMAIVGAAWATMFIAIKSAIAGVTLLMPPVFATVIHLVVPTGLAASLSLYFGGMLSIHGFKSFKDRTFSESRDGWLV